MRASILAGTALAGAFLMACMASRKSATGFHLPDGNVEAGKRAFTELRCNSCHQVKGISLPRPVADPPVPVVLGGIVPQPRTDGELTAAIVDPSHRFAPGYPKEQIRAGTRSRMGDFSEAMTVRQLIDLVAFLQSTYDVQPPPPAGP